MPLHYSVLVPIYQVTGDSTGFFLAGRFLFLCLLAANGFLIWRLALRLMSSTWAGLAVLIYFISMVTVEKGIDIRPDNLMVTLLLCSIWLVTSPGDQRASGKAFLAGVAAGLSLFSSVKALFPVMAIFIGIVCTRSGSFKRFLQMMLGLVSVLVMGIFVTYRMDFLGGMIQFNIIENSNWMYRFPWIRGFDTLVRYDALILLLWAWGVAAALWKQVADFRKRNTGREMDDTPLTAILVLSFLSIVTVIVFIIPNPYLHNYLFLSALGAILGSLALCHIPLFRRHNGRAVVCLAIVFCVLGWNRMPRSLDPQWSPQIRKILHVRELAGVDGRVLDDWTGRGTLCLPAGFFPFMHIGLIRQYGPEIRQDVLDILETKPPPVITVRTATLEGCLNLLKNVERQYEYDPDAKLWFYTGLPAANSELRKPPPKRKGVVRSVLTQR